MKQNIIQYLLLFLSLILFQSSALADVSRVFDSGNIEVGYVVDDGRVFHSGNIEVGYLVDAKTRIAKGGAALLLLLKK